MEEKPNEVQSIDPNDFLLVSCLTNNSNTSEAPPTTYFFKDFLGFSEDKNSKIVTKRFYDQASSFINTNFPNMEERLNLLNALKVSLVQLK